MGGGGFMQHASDTNRADKAQKTSRREKFSGNHSDRATLNNKSRKKLSFKHLTQEQIRKERKRIQKVFLNRRIKNTLAYFLFLSIVIFAFLWWWKF